MGYELFIFLFHTFAMVLLIGMALMLMLATRFKGDSCYAALIIFTITLPDYFYNVCSYLGWNDVALLIAPIAYSVNLTLMPFMLLLAHRAFNPRYRFRYSALIHFLPAVAFGILVAFHIGGLSLEEVRDFSVERTAGFRSLLTAVNFLILLVQLIVYFYLIFRYLRRVRHYIFSNFTQPELSGKVWIPRFITFVGALVVVAMVGSHFDPLGGFRLFYLINVIAMGYLVYQELEHAHAFRRSSIRAVDAVSSVTEEEVQHFDEALPQPEPVKDKNALMKEYADKVEEYLKSSEVYVNPNLTLAEVANATRIPARNISEAINTVLKKTFFDLVNGLRIEKSKVLLKQKKQQGFTLETIAEQCGFNSQYTFCRAFKKAVGVSTSEWLRLAE